ncbi:MAG: LysR family transcriptional regulator [Rhodococcus sp. (in: high G+C Gram-positive bacteria)]|nr:MAG: LysR family transcriptional regulator [Rhodococcus sp. (in: high G+C Gram-positive bacteria)]
MEMRQIEYFLAIADHGGISAAARALDTAQPTLSQAVRALERELGAPLFHRMGRGLTLTAAGRALIGPSRRLMRNLLNWPEVLVTNTDDLGGRLDIAVFPALADSVVDLIAEFSTRHPRVEVHVADLHDDHPRATDVLRNGTVDAVVMHLPVVDDALAVLPLGKQDFVAIYPPKTDLPPGPVDLSRLPDLPMVFVPETHSLSREVGKAMRCRGGRPRVATLTEHREALVPLVAAGVGGAIVDRSMAEAATGLITIRPLEPPVTRQFGLVYDEARLTPTAETFLALAPEHATGNGYFPPALS